MARPSADELREKKDAIKTLLPFVTAHQFLIPGAIKIALYHASEVIPGPPPPPWVTCDCLGYCRICSWQNDCKGEMWERFYHWIRRAYRVKDIECELGRLKHEWPYMARQVIDCYAEPWCEWGEEGRREGDSEPIDEWRRKRRRQWAEKGVEIIARRIRGPVVGYQVEKPKETYMPAKEKRKWRTRRILEMWGKERLTTRDIANKLECSLGTVNATLKGKRLLHGRGVRSE